MDDGKAEGADLKKLLLLARRVQPSFAFCRGWKDDHALLIDKATSDEAQAKPYVLLGYLDGLDPTLEKPLGRLSKTSDSDQCDDLKSATQGVIDQHRGVLDTGFLVAVDKNGFVDSNIHATTLIAPQQVGAVLDA